MNWVTWIVFFIISASALATLLEIMQPGSTRRLMQNIREKEYLIDREIRKDLVKLKRTVKREKGLKKIEARAWIFAFEALDKAARWWDGEA